MGLQEGIAWVCASGILISGMISGCGYFGDNYDYPSLDMAKLTGCWIGVDAHPTFPCDEMCFSVTGIAYSRTNYSGEYPGENRFSEMAGTFSKTDRNTLTFRARFGNNAQKPDTASDKFDDNYTIKRDTLYSIGNGGGFSPYVRVNPSHPCGPHWQIFPEPDGWDLD